jgi:uncharacterized protein YndB with AHSA1/START domain
VNLPLIGSIRQPLRGEVSLHMAAPPAEVWSLVSDVTRIGEFSPETFEARWSRGSTGPEVGAYFKGHVKRNGVGPTYWSLCRVTECVPHEVFEFSVGSDDVTLNNWGYRLEPSGSGTKVTEYFRIQPNLAMRAYWTVFGPLRSRTNRHGMRTTLERMKAVVEA